ncbi:putative thiazole-containing bacteriocin maturation protein [Marininema mesophilum]|nr:putative thiazole-containing bacteriocin maturation protein [Marininema mesophilum]
MTSLQSSTRLKMNGDTFILPDVNGGVYLRNNRCSFRLDGEGIAQWIERLTPMFDGKEPLSELTEGLPKPYQERIYEIANMLHNQGMARDVSQDQPHHLFQEVVDNFASQIAFLEAFGDSGAYRFERFRQTKVLVVGAGSTLIALVGALWQSGYPHVHLLLSEEEETDRERLEELKEQARSMDPEVGLAEISIGGFNGEDLSSWEKVIAPYEVVLLLVKEERLDRLRLLQRVCQEKKTALLPGIIARDLGWVGPWMNTEGKGCWESAWCRMNRQVWESGQSDSFSITTDAMLANVMAFTCFKELTQTNLQSEQQIYLLHGETLEGSWHSFIPHPQFGSIQSPKRVTQEWWSAEKGEGDRKEEEMFLAFAGWTSPVTGIYRHWEEGSLGQLPLAQCKVQVMDPVTEGLADPLHERIGVGITHREARREAGLTGMETYVSRWLKEKGGQQRFIGLGAGATLAEGVCRGLQKCLVKEWKKSLRGGVPRISSLRLGAMEDRDCRFYLEVWSRRGELPRLGRGEEVCGFPVIWVGDGESWYGSIGFHESFALKRALRYALGRQLNPQAWLTEDGMEVTTVTLENSKPRNLEVSMNIREVDFIQDTQKILQRNQRQLEIVDCTLEPFMKEGLAGVFGVTLLRKEDSQ